jgi:hypothetical protein
VSGLSATITLRCADGIIEVADGVEIPLPGVRVWSTIVNVGGIS